MIYNLQHVTSGGYLGFASDGATVAYRASSSKRYKNHVSDMTLEEAEKVLNIPVVWFKYKDGYLDINDPMVGKPVPGMYAEDVFDSFPEATYNNPEGQVENWNERMLMPESYACAVVAATIGECGICGWIRTTKDKKLDRKWQKQDEREAQDVPDMNVGNMEDDSVDNTEEDMEENEDDEH